MIDESRTLEIYGYTSDDLKPHSVKRIIAVCDDCGHTRGVRMGAYTKLCRSCANSASWKRPEIKASRISGIKRANQHPEVREKLRTAAHKRYADPEFRAKHRAAMKERANRPENIDRMRKNNVMHDPEVKTRHLNVMRSEECHTKICEINSSFEHRMKDSATHQGVAYEEWEGFANTKYCPRYNEACRERIREKYGRKCFICGKPELENLTHTGEQRKLSIHHVDRNKEQGCGGHNWSLVPLCMRHHGCIHTDVWESRIAFMLNNNGGI